MMSFLIRINKNSLLLLNENFSDWITKLTSTLAAIRNEATAINCRFFCVTNPLPAVVEVIHCWRKRSSKPMQLKKKY